MVTLYPAAALCTPNSALCTLYSVLCTLHGVGGGAGLLPSVQDVEFGSLFPQISRLRAHLEESDAIS